MPHANNCYFSIKFEKKKDSDTDSAMILSAAEDEGEKTIEPLEEEKVAASTTKKRKRKGTSSGNSDSLTTLCYLLHST